MISCSETRREPEATGETNRLWEIKTPRDDITRGIGQLAEALAYGYSQVALVTTLRTAKKIDSAVFDRLGLVLLGIDSKGNVQQVYQSYASREIG